MPPKSILGSLSNIEMAEWDGWSRLTEVAKDKRLVLDTFGVGPTKGMIECRCQRGAQGTPSV